VRVPLALLTRTLTLTRVRRRCDQAGERDRLRPRRRRLLTGHQPGAEDGARAPRRHGVGELHQHAQPAGAVRRVQAVRHRARARRVRALELLVDQGGARQPVDDAALRWGVDAVMDVGWREHEVKCILAYGYLPMIQMASL
jgi:hypothetical protein